MREIRFRAWDERKEIMHNDFQFVRSGTSGNDWILFVSDKQPIEGEHDKWTTNPYFAQQLKIMQYTGLKDKNGKEIYEGDILGSQIMNLRCFVERDSDYCQFNIDSEYVQQNYIEVIGNIHNNPELLKGEK